MIEFGMIPAAEQEQIAKYFKRMSKKGKITQKEETEDEEEVLEEEGQRGPRMHQRCC